MVVRSVHLAAQGVCVTLLSPFLEVSWDPQTPTLPCPWGRTPGFMKCLQVSFFGFLESWESFLSSPLRAPTQIPLGLSSQQPVVTFSTSSCCLVLLSLEHGAGLGASRWSLGVQTTAHVPFGFTMGWVCSVWFGSVSRGERVLISILEIRGFYPEPVEPVPSGLSWN